MKHWAALLMVGVLGLPAVAKTHHKTHRVKPLKVQIAKLLADPSVSEAHWGIAVTRMDGKPIYMMNEGQLFQPASNAKLFTTAAAVALLGPETTYQTRVVARGVFDGVDKLTGDVVLIGAGDANLSGRALPYVAPADRPVPAAEPDPLRYLEQMADQVAATGLKVVNGDVVGDDTLFPWEPYAADWSIDDAVWGYGAPVSALTINDNQIKVTVTPGDTEGKPATVVLDPAVSYYTLDVAVTTGAAKSESSVEMERMPVSKVLRIYGSIAVDAKPDEEELAIQDPAEYAAMALKGMLEARGIVVTGKARAQHRLSSDTQGFTKESTEPIADLTQRPSTNAHCADCSAESPAEKLLASHTSPTLEENLVVTNKVSQNLHAELFLHQLGFAVVGDGSTAQGARVVRAFLESAGIDKNDFVFFDGSGLSGHDLVAPRATAKLLLYASAQPWFAAWKKSLPVGGEDGSLAERFSKAPLKEHVFAKTGTLGEARALSGYLECASGKTVIFSIMVGNHLPSSHADREAMDKIVAAIAETN
jgi:D-alanyl-D-alanine carboxypeptidase/D-alanyl-D-alanine-endopeptidase (penicillin-binding protein 4)